jgi:predicted Zn-dependent protease
MSMRRVVGTLILAALALFAQIKEPKPGFNLFSKEQDVQLGKEAAAQVEKELEIIRDGRLQSYIDTLGARLTKSPRAGGFPYSFKIVHDDSINAFALPGGPMFVHTGLIKAADNEAQLAGVMGHEISHVALRHGTNQVSKANLIQLPAMLAGQIGGGGLAGGLAQLGIGFGANSVMMKFSRSAETQADTKGTLLLADAGYNPIEMARFFEKLQGEGAKSSRVAEFFSSHPNPGNRVKSVEALIRQLPRQNFTNGDAGAFQEAKAIVGRLPAPKPRKPAAKTATQGDAR